MGTIMNRQLPGMLLTAFAFCISISCSDKSATDPTGLELNDSTAAEARIASASVTLAQSSLEVGQTTQATALLLDRYNNPLNLRVVWSTSDSSLATVSGSGLVTAISPGAVSIIATRSGKSGSATLTVTPSTAIVASVTVNLAASSLTVGQTEKATATLRDSSNNVVIGPAVVWTSSNASAATLTDSGMVTALAAGSTVISASTGGTTGTAPLAVTATSPVPVASVTVSPASATIQIGATVQLQVSAFDANNNVLTGRVVTSSSGNPAIASVNSLGLVTGVSAGTTQITVTSEGVSAVATITVSASAPPPTTNPGTVTNLQASVTGSSSVTLSFTQVDDGTGHPAKYDVRYAVAPISWGSAPSTTSGTCTTPVAGTAIGSQISCTVLGLAPATNYNFQLIAFRGTLNVDAVFGGLSNVASGTTTASGTSPAPVASVSVSPASATLQIGATVQLQVTAYDANNNVLTGRVVTSSSANPAIASVNSLGLVTAVSAGTTQITVTVEGKTAVATITVSAAAPVAVASVTVSPSSASLLVGGTQQFSATTRDANNNVLTGRVVTWSTAGAGIASVSANGFVTAVAAGTTQITATSEGKSGSATITVSVPPPPPPPGSSNEPSGMTFIDERAFDTPTDPAWYYSSGISIVSDASAPKSASNIGRLTYPAGMADGSAPGHTDFAFGSSPRHTAYVSFWGRLSSNWYGDASGTNKICYFWADTNLIPFFISAEGSGTGALVPTIQTQALLVPSGNQNYGPNLVPTAQIIRGQWFHLEIIAHGNSSGQSDGSIDWYLNGVHVGSINGLQFTSGATQWSEFRWYPVWGGNNGPSLPATQYQDVDDIYISGKN
jgi:trimeric autotransporter adhesin